VSRPRNRSRMLRWDLPETPPPKHPYRDTLLVNAGLAGIIVLVAWATGGSLLRSVGFAVVFYVVACSWTWWRWRQRLARRPADTEDGEAQG
jgi:Flp pilus assembly protein TadB